MKKIVTSSMKLGFFQLLPLIILLIVCYFVINIVVPFLLPTLSLFHLKQMLGATGGIIVFIIILIVISFFVGAIVRTAIGEKLKSVVESKILDLIPGYKMLVEVFEPLKGEKELIKGEVALAKLGRGSVLTTVYILNSKAGIAKALLVCGGNPGMILVVYIPSDRIVKLDNVKFQDSFKTLLSFGAGSSEVLKSYYEVMNHEKTV